jgi:hypothetical protein
MSDYVVKPLGPETFAGQGDHRAPADLGHLAPHVPASWEGAYEGAAACRHDARSPHSSGSSAGCSS